MANERVIYECHDCYGQDGDCDRCLGTNRVCSLCERGECSSNRVRPKQWSEVCILPELEARERERDAKEAEFQRKRREKKRLRLDALYFSLGIMTSEREEITKEADPHTLVRYDDAIAVLHEWIAEMEARPRRSDDEA